jgi:adenylylsulfate kinase
MTKRAIFVGRFSPFHKGHFAIMKQKIDQGIPLLILVRDTPYDIYSPMLRKRMIEATMIQHQIDAKVVIIDDIESINYGRGVGYEINELEVTEEIKSVSATEIRRLIDNNDNSWKKFMPKGADKVLHDYLSNNGLVIWFTGLPKSGKSTISNLLSTELENIGIKAEQLDSKILRKTISKDLGFNKEDRNQNISRAMHIAKMLTRNGAIVLSSFITPYESQRNEIRKELEKHGNFIEVYIKSSIDECKKRDNENLYKKAENGEIKQFTGISDPFDEPKSQDITLNTDKNSMEECTKELLKFIQTLI